MEVLGIDIGGTGIKGAPIDVRKGELTRERFRLLTPQPSTPQAVAETVAEVVAQFAWRGPLGCTLPAVLKKGIAQSAANIDKSWLGADAQRLLAGATGCPTLVINDADAAGIAEMTFGAGRRQKGVVIMITLGTGIGSAVFLDGQLVPNTEFGHLEIRGKEAEDRAADSVRKRKGLGWKKWAARLDEYLDTMERLFSPELFIIGGGVSQQHQKFIPLLSCRAPVVPAQMLNEAGIIGAALAASVWHTERSGRPGRAARGPRTRRKKPSGAKGSGGTR
jgi:polyphosphate glucokinase